VSSIQSTGLLVKRLQMQHHRAANNALAALGVTLVQWDALRHLAANPAASLHDLAVLTFQTDQSFGALAARMEARGLIERIAGPGRAVRHRLTAEGAQVRKEGSALVERVLQQSFAPLTPTQLKSLDKLLRLIVRE
jgi:DNA-binding MarR family transcriptional regulator